MRTVKRHVEKMLEDERENIKHKNVLELQEGRTLDYSLWAEQLVDNINDAVYGLKDLKNSQKWITELLIKSIEKRTEPKKETGGAGGDDEGLPV
jgi:hypothetical protein